MEVASAEGETVAAAVAAVALRSFSFSSVLVELEEEEEEEGGGGWLFSGSVSSYTGVRKTRHGKPPPLILSVLLPSSAWPLLLLLVSTLLIGLSVVKACLFCFIKD